MWIPRRQSEGEVQSEVAPQSYSVESNGNTIRRNRRDLIRLPNPENVVTHSEPSEQTDARPGEQAQSNDHDRRIISDNSNDRHDSNDSSDASNATAQPTVRRSGRHSIPPNRLDPSWTW